MLLRTLKEDSVFVCDPISKNILDIVIIDRYPLIRTIDSCIPNSKQHFSTSCYQLIKSEMNIQPNPRMLAIILDLKVRK